MASIGVCPTPSTHRKALKACCKNKRADLILQMHQKMTEIGLDPDITVYNTLIHVLCKLGMTSKAAIGTSYC